MAVETKVPFWKQMRRERLLPHPFRQHFGLDLPPIRIERLLPDSGIEILRGRGGVVAGRLELTAQRARMWINTDDPEDRQRFTFAYLLGHLILHPEGEYSCPHAVESAGGNPEALAFAKQLLMPGPLVTRFHGEPTDKPLHALFGVPKEVMNRRLEELGLQTTPGTTSPPMPLRPGVASRPLPYPTEPEAADEPTLINNDDDEKTDPGISAAEAVRPPPADAGAERRQFERVPARIEVRFEQPRQAAKALRAFSLDLSAGGLCLRTRRRYSLGETLNLQMKIGEHDFRLEGVVAWMRDGVIGVRFHQISGKDRQRLAAIVQSLGRGTFRPQD
jgi:uncharacterized protein (TIGR02266 family)